MFTTFAAVSPRMPNTDLQETAPTSLQNNQLKRSQVNRACDWCRVHRIRCDNNYPCHNCQIKERQCSKRGTTEIRTLPNALRQALHFHFEGIANFGSSREVERLKSRVKELEARLEQNKSISLTPSLSSSSISSSSLTPPLHPLKEHGGTKKYWQGIYTSTTQSNKNQSYGPSSSFYFMGRMSAYLSTVLQQPHPDFPMQPNGASSSRASPMSPRRGNSGESLINADISDEEASITSTQEDYFLGLFWQSYHSTLQVLDEAEFKEHYKSLWVESKTSRKPSALVDIVLALCMQYGVALLPRRTTSTGDSPDVDNDDATIAGRWFYRRCQSLLTNDLESPSIMTVQCHIFSVIYLCNASFQNMAHSTLALAIRTAQIIGLHLEPSEDLPRNQRELRKRLWWTLYALEIKTCMKLGRPVSAQLAQVTCSLPDDDHALALLSGTNCASYGEKVTWFTYTRENTKLILAAYAVYVAFYDKCTQVLNANGGQSLYHDAQSLEVCAESLQSSMATLQAWMDDLPDALKIKRNGSGESPQLNGSASLEIELFVPVWLQRQRLLLELLYHNLAMNLYRPFICFGAASDPSTPHIEKNAVLCVTHAITITRIMHQMITQTDILNAWHEAYMWQW